MNDWSSAFLTDQAKEPLGQLYRRIHKRERFSSGVAALLVLLAVVARVMFRIVPEPREMPVRRAGVVTRAVRGMMRGLARGGQQYAQVISQRDTVAKTSEKRVGLLRTTIWSVLLGGPMVLLISQPFSVIAHALFIILLWILAMVLRSLPGRYPLLALSALSVLVSARYIWWRYTATLHWDKTFDLVLGLLLLAAETYSWIVLLLGYVQTAWPLRRTPVNLPKDMAQWPTVDVLIPTYNESLDVVKPVIYAAMNMDWPAKKLKIYLLDDGRREEFKQLAQTLGIHYLARCDNRHAKAGNLNHALEHTQGELVALFDCDHIPVRAFLQLTVGLFLRSKRLALVQTPHHFFSADPFEQNLGYFGDYPSENNLFYGLVQDGNDLWNAAFFCGSCAVLRRQALQVIGGFAVETVTEDAHTALRLHRHGYTSAYIRIPLAAGLATDRLSAHVGQRIRWARGMVQIFRLDNPLMGSGLSALQRVCYCNAMLHFLSGFPRLIYLLAPLAFLILHSYIIYAPGLLIIIYVLPHIGLANMAHSRLVGPYRRSFYSEIYETVLAWYIAWPTLVALITPHKGRFNITDKGAVATSAYFDWRIARPFLFLALANAVGVAFGIDRLISGPSHEMTTVLITLVWAAANLFVLGGAIAVASEAPRHASHRVSCNLPCHVVTAGGHAYAGTLLDYSMSGAHVRLAASTALRPGDGIRIRLGHALRCYEFAGVIVRDGKTHLGIRFEPLSLQQEMRLVHATFARTDSWMDAHSKFAPDRPLQSLIQVLKIGVQGYTRLWFAVRSLPWLPRRPRATHVMLILALWASSTGWAIGAEVIAPHRQNELGLDLLAAQSSRRLDGIQNTLTMEFTVRKDHIVSDASLDLSLMPSPVLLPLHSHLKVSLNDELMATVPVVGQEAGARVHRTIALEPRLMRSFNRIVLEFIGHYTDRCEDLANSALWLEIGQGSRLSISEHAVPLSNDLSFFPEPFFDADDMQQQTISFVFPSSITRRRIQAAGLLASYFGREAHWRPLNFAVFQDKLPSGHAVIFATNEERPEFLKDYPAVSRPTIDLLSAIDSPYKKWLLVLGRNEHDLLLASQALAFESPLLRGASVTLDGPITLPARHPYDAPRWLSTTRPVYFSELQRYPGQLAVSGLRPRPITLDINVPPDLFVWQNTGIPAVIRYRHSALARTDGSSLTMKINDQLIDSFLLSSESARGKRNDLRFAMTRHDRSANNQETLIPALKVGTNNLLQFDFTFATVRANTTDQECRTLIASDAHAAIDERSMIDFSGFHHYLEMPDLHAFAMHGYPFSRLADLSETLAVIPANPTSAQLETLFEAIAHISARTGYAAFGLRVFHDLEAALQVNADLLVIDDLNETLLEQPDARLLYRQSINVDHAARVHRAPLSAIVGMQSPHYDQRSVVALLGSDDASLALLREALQDAGKRKVMRGSVVRIRQSGVASALVGPSYYVGHLPWYQKLRHRLSDAPVLLAGVVALFVLLLAWWLWLLLYRKARQRLNGYHDE